MAKKAKVKFPSAKTGQLGADPFSSDAIVGATVPSANGFKPSPMGPGAMPAYKPSSLISAKMPSDFNSVSHQIDEMEMQAESMPDEQKEEQKVVKKALVKKMAQKKKVSVKKKKPNMQEMSDAIDAGRGDQYIKG